VQRIARAALEWLPMLTLFRTSENQQRLRSWQTADSSRGLHSSGCDDSRTLHKSLRAFEQSRQQVFERLEAEQRPTVKCEAEEDWGREGRLV
jgi:hypothetical protein